jgi:hypothetical protein
MCVEVPRMHSRSRAHAADRKTRKGFVPLCFLSYSEAYRPIMETIRHLLEVLEFRVDVFDGPDLDRPPLAEFQHRLLAADCVVVLLAPKVPNPGQRDLEPAPWPAEEGIYAVAKDKPVALIVHAGTRIPETLRQLQTPARFDFWNPVDFQKHVHHVTKHLLDLKRRIDMPPGNQPFLFTKLVARTRVMRDNTLKMELYHEVVARQSCARFDHHLDTGLDARERVIIRLVSPEAYLIEATLQSIPHDISMQFGAVTSHRIPYVVNVAPPLAPGERLGYLREFTLNNFFPLTRGELLQMAGEEGFPAIYKQDGHPYYGRVWDVIYDMESITVALHFPRKVKIRSKRALALTIASGTVNVLETERCNSNQCLTLEEVADSGERVLCLQVRRPLMNHQYILLYEPDD